MRKLFLLWLLSNVFNFVVGQQHSFLQFSLPEGLPQSQVRTLMQDSKGYIWVGTLGGASKFNGKNFVNYDRSSGLINNQINTIIEDAKG